jgi:hypothetical protein
MRNSIRNWQADLNSAKLSFKRVWGVMPVCKFYDKEGVKFVTLTYYGCTIRDHVRVVFCNQPTYGQYLMVMSVLAKPSMSAFVLCENISKLTLWSDK